MTRSVQILTTALFSVLLLRKSLTSKKWIALVLLTLGVTLAQTPSTENAVFDPLRGPDSRFHFPRSFHELGTIGGSTVEVARELTKRGFAEVSEGLQKRSATYEGIEEDLGLKKPVMNYSAGLLAVLTAAATSGLSGVYFEKVLKDSPAPASVWIRNVQLSFYSLFPAAFIGVLFQEGDGVIKDGFFTGYNGVVWATIYMQALGGVLVALCINYADNIAKNFATSISIIISFLFSVFVFDFRVTPNVSPTFISLPPAHKILI